MLEGCRRGDRYYGARCGSAVEERRYGAVRGQLREKGHCRPVAPVLTSIAAGGRCGRHCATSCLVIGGRGWPEGAAAAPRPMRGYGLALGGAVCDVDGPWLDGGVRTIRSTTDYKQRPWPSSPQIHWQWYSWLVCSESGRSHMSKGGSSDRCGRLSCFGP